MQSYLNNQMGSAKRKDRMRAKLAEKQKNEKTLLEYKDTKDGMENYVFTKGEQTEKEK